METVVNKDFEDFFHLLNKYEVEYLIVGGYAVVFYSEVMYTKDLDIWINPKKKNIKKVINVIKEFLNSDVEIDERDFSEDKIFQIGIEPNRIDLITKIEGVNFEKSYKKKEIATYGKEKIYIIDIDDLIKNKEILKRPQDILHLKKLKGGKN
jgi:hypothetical protein